MGLFSGSDKVAAMIRAEQDRQEADGAPYARPRPAELRAAQEARDAAWDGATEDERAAAHGVILRSRDAGRRQVRG